MDIDNYYAIKKKTGIHHSVFIIRYSPISHHPSVSPLRITHPCYKTLCIHGLVVHGGTRSIPVFQEGLHHVPCERDRVGKSRIGL